MTDRISKIMAKGFKRWWRETLEGSGVWPEMTRENMPNEDAARIVDAVNVALGGAFRKPASEWESVESVLDSMTDQLEWFIDIIYEVDESLPKEERRTMSEQDLASLAIELIREAVAARKKSKGKLLSIKPRS